MASRTQSSCFAGAQKGMGLAHGNRQRSRSKVTRVCAPRNFLAGILANPFDFRQAFHFSAAIDLIRTQLHVPLNHMRGSHATRVGLGRSVLVAVRLFCKMTLLLLCAACAQAVASETDQKTIQERIAALERRLEEQAREIERLRAEQQQLLERLDLTAGANSPLVAGPASVPVPIGTRSSSSPATAQ